MNRRWKPSRVALVAALLVPIWSGLGGRAALGQSSSLYIVDSTEAAPGTSVANQPRPRAASPAAATGPGVRPPEAEPPAPRRPLAAVSYTAISAPEPRKFARHDLITIIIREQSTATSEATLETEKEATIDGRVNAFPRFRLKDLVDLQLRNSDPEDLPSVDVRGSNEFEGEGEYERRDTLTTRLTARIADVKPNGTLTLEARSYIRNDDEELTIGVTGVCRAQDVTADNTILSTQVYDLRISKVHEGEMRKTTKKGLLTKVLETIFNF